MCTAKSVTRTRKMVLREYLQTLRQLQAHGHRRQRLNRAIIEKALVSWAYNTFHRKNKVRPQQTLKRSTCREYLRHVRQAWLRNNMLSNSPLPDPGRLIWWQDLKRYAIKEARKDTIDACTPLTPQQFKQLFHAARRQLSLRQTLAVLSAVGAARYEEMRHMRSTIRKLTTCYEILVFPKGGREWKLASLPRNAIIDDIMNMKGSHLQSPATSVTYQAVYKHIKQTAQHYNWPPGKYATYSLRHGALTLAFYHNTKEKHVRLQTGHQRQIPFTYRRNHNPRRALQLQVVTPVFQAIGLTPQHHTQTPTSPQLTQQSSTSQPLAQLPVPPKTLMSAPISTSPNTHHEPHLPTTPISQSSPHEFPPMDIRPPLAASNQMPQPNPHQPRLSNPVQLHASTRSCSLAGAVLNFAYSPQTYSNISTYHPPPKAGSALLHSYQSTPPL